MPTYDVDLLLNVASIGRLGGTSTPVTRTIVANSLEEAIVQAKRDLLIVKVVRAAELPPGP